MQKIIYTAVALFFLTSTASFCSGEDQKTGKELQAIMGVVVSIDPIKDEVVIKDTATGAEKTFSVSRKMILHLKAGEIAEVSFIPGSNKVRNLKMLIGADYQKADKISH